MALHHRRRPTPIKIFTTRPKRQEAGLGAVGPGSEEEPEGPESPDSPGSSPSTAGASSPGDSSDSEDDEPPSPKESSSPSASQLSSTSSATSIPPSSSSRSAAQLSTTTTPTKQTETRAMVTSSTSSTTGQIAPSSSIATDLPSITLVSTTRGIGAIAPQPTESAATIVVTSVTTSYATSLVSPASPTSKFISKPTPNSTSKPTSSQIFSSQIARPTNPVTTTIVSLPPPSSSISGVPVGENDPPRQTRPQPTIISKGAVAAAIALSILGAIALAVGIILYCKRRHRRRNEKLEAELERDAATHAALQRPQVAYVSTTHMTQYSDRSNTLFGAGSYTRPETVSTRNGSRAPQATPNPFADPPLNKAYDVLGGRPRSTTLTDRGSWIKNPFKDPESERFDPFGELQAKARRERVKQVELARREVELERQFEEKEKMGLAPPERAANRKGSGVTLDGLGVLDRSAGGAYR